MSVVSKLADSIDNGLQIVEFIQENREELQKTYGRSKISDPKSKERIQAWEAFIAKKSGSNSGPEGSRTGSNDIREGIQRTNPNNNRDESHEVSNSDNTISVTDGNGNNNSRNDTDTDKSEDPELRGDNESFGYPDRRGCVNLEGNDEYEVSTRDSERDGNNSSPHDQVEGATGGKEDKLFTPRVISIKETTPEDLEQMLEEIRPIPSKRIKHISEITKNAEEVPQPIGPIKKTTQESTVSIHSVVKPSLRAGATLGVQESSQYQLIRDVSVESAQTDVHSVSTTMTDDEQFEELSSNFGNTTIIKLDEILSNQRKILEKLAILGEIKEEIIGIKKVLTNQGVAISTIDSYINDLKIIIPKSGVMEEPKNGPVNPDLKMVIGRDRTRARAEMVKPKNKHMKIEISEDLYAIPEIDDQYITKDLDNTKNNAANFVPTDDRVSIEIIKGIIHNEVGDPDMINQFLELVDVGVHSMSVREVYDNVRALLNELHDHENTHYSSKTNK